jgi:hypothetical protein
VTSHIKNKTTPTSSFFIAFAPWRIEETGRAVSDGGYGGSVVREVRS